MFRIYVQEPSLGPVFGTGSAWVRSGAMLASPVMLELYTFPAVHAGFVSLGLCHGLRHASEHSSDAVSRGLSGVLESSGSVSVLSQALLHTVELFPLANE